MKIEKKILLTVVVPMRNEAEHVGEVLAALNKLRDNVEVEIIVLDNFSTDRSLQIVRSLDVKVFCEVEGPISRIRNLGAQWGEGEIISFIDADVLVTESWRDAIPEVISNLQSNPMQVVGARCHGSFEFRFFDKLWYDRLTEYPAKYINSGNLITSRKLFSMMQGFNESLETAEDYDFCERATAFGAAVTNIKALKVHHLGYPYTVNGFFKRERWHGKQDFSSFRSIVRSKMAWIAILNISMLIICIFNLFLSKDIIWLGIYSATLYGLGVLLTFMRYKFRKLPLLPITAGIFVLYVLGRSASALDRLVKK